MNKKKILIISSVAAVIAAAVLILVIFNNKNKIKVTLCPIQEVKEKFDEDLTELKENRYDNLIYNDFITTFPDVEALYDLEIETDNAYLNRTTLENFHIMQDAINKFFKEDFDKSYIDAEFIFSYEDGGTEYINYNDVETKCKEDKYNKFHNNSTKLVYLFGNNTANGGYMVQTSEMLVNTWFSKYGMNSISPLEFDDICLYLNGVRQGNDFKVSLKDDEVNISTLENKVLDFVNKDFLLPVSDNINYIIGQAKIFNKPDCMGIGFTMRRVYKNVPFEYGSFGSSGNYNDNYEHDSGTVYYCENEDPDTMLAFGITDGIIMETEEISEIIDLKQALEIVSKKVGKNSVYDVKGIELVYRSDMTRDESNTIVDRLSPKWKIIAVNKNDDKLTLFYVDAVSGRLTERFEYYTK